MSLPQASYAISLKGHVSPQILTAEKYALHPKGELEIWLEGERIALYAAGSWDSITKVKP
jgi:hypothetical protein